MAAGRIKNILTEDSMETQNSILNKSSFWTNLFKEPTEGADLEKLIASMPPFKNIGKKYRKLILQILHNRVYEAGEYIFYQGDPGIGFYIVREGEVSIVQEDSNGNNRELTRLTRGDFFGELSMLDEEIRSASAVALKDSKLAVLFKPDLDEFIDKYPKIGIEILRGLSKIVVTRLRNLNFDFIALHNKSIQKLEGN